ncbi:MAG: hypothetical protein BEN19_00745 [Epulopiscium sp. Nuni2H_MBin003]|nr:MAG: hypothetical protein BEN19_00745 [Epulopiscium sp. Nuni2H_MBin003]
MQTTTQEVGHEYLSDAYKEFLQQNSIREKIDNYRNKSSVTLNPLLPQTVIDKVNDVDSYKQKSTIENYVKELTKELANDLAAKKIEATDVVPSEALKSIAKKVTEELAKLVAEEKPEKKVAKELIQENEPCERVVEGADNIEDIKEPTEEQLKFIQEFQQKLQALKQSFLLNMEIAEEEDEADEEEVQEMVAEYGDIVEALEDKDSEIKKIHNEVVKVKQALDQLKLEYPEDTVKAQNVIFRDVEPQLSYVKQAETSGEFARLDYLFENNMRVEPFGNNAFPIDWINVSLAELISIPQVNCDWATQSKISQSYHKYGHLIIGKEQDSRKYYIGIPDTAMRSRRNSIDIEKVIEFVLKQGRKTRGHENGYWIAHM